MTMSLLAQTQITTGHEAAHFAASASASASESMSIFGDALGVILILATIGLIVTLIVTVVCVCRLINNFHIVKMHHRLVNELLQKGYSVDDIERLTVGQGIGGKVKKLYRAAANRMNSNVGKSMNPGQKPVPPIKQSA